MPALTAELARSPVTCPPIGEASWQAIATNAACWKEAARQNGALAKALQSLFDTPTVK
jgi:hypothetical protein